MGLSTSDAYRNWLMSQLGVTQGGTVADLEAALYAQESLVPSYKDLGAYKSGWWTVPMGGSSTSAPPEAVLTFTPVWIPKSGLSVDRIAAEVTGAGTVGAVVRLGIYKPNADGLPGARLLDAGTFDGTVVQLRTEININQALPAGLLYLAGVVQGAAATRPTMRRVSGSGSAVISSTSQGVTSAQGGYEQSGVSGALPPVANVTDSTPGAIRAAVRFT